MRIPLFLIPMVPLLIAADFSWKNRMEKERRAFQGFWKVVHFGELIGKNWQIEKPKDEVVVFKGKRLFFKFGEMNFTLKLNRKKKPNWIGLVMADEGKKEVLKGIYQLKGNILKICLNYPGGKRPTNFRAGGKHQLMLMVLKRLKTKTIEYSSPKARKTMPRLRQHFVWAYGRESDTSCLAFSPDSKTLASGGTDTTITLRDITFRKKSTLLRGHTGSVNCLAYSPNGRVLASGGEDKTVRLWNFRAKKQIAVLQGHTKEVRSVKFSPGGTVLASVGDDKTIRFWEMPKGKERGIIKDGNSSWTIAFFPDGKTLASAGSGTAVKIWDVGTKRLRTSLKVNTSGIYSLAISPDGKNLACGDFKGEVIMWDLKTRRELGIPNKQQSQQKEYDVQALFSLAFSPDGKWLASVPYDGPAVIWDVATRKLRMTILSTNQGDLQSVAFSPNGKWLALGGGADYVELWGIRRMRGKK
jgi:uncharacterized protein (TIGR03067 family)